ncbi:kelch-like protein 24a [Branchiostoma lanceolatum]|uniref:kelch-like protein 24a n=1 Tax=Branchiostoma lanceolatum TaxID=7740 RepID=UPI0034550985
MEDDHGSSASSSDSSSTDPPVNGCHGEWFFSELQKMRSEGQLVDVTLCAEGKEIPCHRVVLATCSDYFRSMFSVGLSESKKDKIEMGGVSAEALQQLVDYAYTSKVKVTEENIRPLFEAADMLQFLKVYDQCKEFLQDRRVNEETCLGIWALTDRVSCTRLAETAKSCALKWFEEVCATKEFLQLPVHLLKTFISDQGLLARKEERVLEVIMLWVRHDLEQREDHLKELLKSVCFSRMDQDYLQNILKTDKVLAGVRGIKPMMKRQPTHPVPRQILQKDLIVVSGVTGIGTTLNNKAYRLELDSNCIDATLLPKPFQDSRGIAACIFRSNVIVTGGDKSMSQAWRYKALTNTWIKLANLRTRRFDHKMVVFRGEVYVVGGAKNGRDSRSWIDLPVRCMIPDVEVHDKKKNRWRIKEPLWLAVSDFAITVCNGKLYAFGGESNREYATDAIQCYNPDVYCETWSLEGWFPEKVARISACTIDSKIYLVGGQLECVVRFDPGKENFRYKGLALRLFPWDECSATVCGSEIYITGGKEIVTTRDGTLHSFQNFATVQCYNVENNTMVLCKDLPEPLYGHCTVTINKSKCANVAQR